MANGKETRENIDLAPESDESASEEEDQDATEQRHTLESFIEIAQCQSNNNFAQSYYNYMNNRRPSNQQSSNNLLNPVKGGSNKMGLAGFGNNMDKRSEKKSQKGLQVTLQKVFDDRVNLVLFKFLGQGFLTAIHGAISTGKEAYVFYAEGPDSKEYALKIFKTSCAVFKDREKYITGNHKFQKNYKKGNTRDNVDVWAEKEFGNLQRMARAGLPVPKPYRLNTPVIAMEFLGKDGDPAPRLKDVDLTTSQARKLYEDTISNMWILFHKCDLVHADLSEYNMLYYSDTAYIIDVSQAVRVAHPQAMNFLRKDCMNITDFFRKHGVPVLLANELFFFIIEKGLKKDLPEYIDSIKEKLSNRDPRNLSPSDRKQEDLFRAGEITKSLNQLRVGGLSVDELVGAPENIEDQLETLVPGPMGHVKNDKKVCFDIPEQLEESSESSNDSDKDVDSDEVDDSDEDDESENRGRRVTQSAIKGQTTEERKERKKEIHKLRAEKRAQKLKKGEKKRLVKKSRAKKK